MRIIKILVAMSAMLICGVQGSKADNQAYVPASDANILYSGRISWKNPESPAFTYPGVSAEFMFEGSTVGMGAKPGSGYFMVEIDDELPFKVHFAENDSVLILAGGLDFGVHRVKVVYAVEGYDFKPEFRGFYIDSVGKMLPCPVRPERKIEFIGNSMMCGYGIEADNGKEDFSFATENHYYSFAAQAARMLKADYNAMIRSGYGVYRNYGGPRSGSDNCIPNLYDRTLFYDAEEKWDFASFRPDVVCVNLGTNDMSLGNYDMSLLKEAYLKFVKRLRGYYPESKIVMLTGCMLTGQRLADVKKVLDEVVAEINAGGDNEVYRFDKYPQTGELGYGADFHPSRRQANKMAKELSTYLAKITGWK